MPTAEQKTSTIRAATNPPRTEMTHGMNLLPKKLTIGPNIRRSTPRTHGY